MKLTDRIRQRVTGKAPDGVNVRLLAKVRRRIIEHPENYNQGQWFQSAATLDDPLSQRGYVTNPDAVLATKHFTGPECGTKACVAGHALVASRRLRHYIVRPGDENWTGGSPDFYSRGGFDPSTVSDVDWQRGGAEVLGIGDLADWLFDSERVERAMPDVLQAIIDGERDREVLRCIERDWM